MAYATITKPGLHFKAKTYTGNAGTQSITGIGFRPDFTWIKRLNTTGGNMWTDVVRGVTKTIISNENSAEQTFANGLTSFDSDGFTLGSEGGFNSGNTFTSFSWKTQNAQGSSNTDGSINTTYTSVNTTTGFSISTYEGTGSAATVGHGLGVTPAMVLVKNIDAAQNWLMYHQGIGATKYLRLNLTNGQGISSGPWNNTAPTSSVFSIGADGAVTGNGQTHVAYCFAEKKGYSKFGTYTGNGNADGTFIYTGFKPAFIMVKTTTSVTEWHVSDVARRPENPNNSYISASSSAAENTGNPTDFLSNGVKIRTSNNGWNKSGDRFIYWAFAENPLVANVGQSIPATAR
jgi:hypothetical protein